MWVAAGLLTRPWRHALLYDARWPWIPAVFLFACGFYIYSRAHLSFDQLIGRPEVQGQADDQGLVMTGIHARVRHPVYLGHLCELLGWSLGTGLVFKLFHVGDTLNLIDPDTLPRRLEAAGMVGAGVKVGGRSFRWRATKAGA